MPISSINWLQGEPRDYGPGNLLEGAIEGYKASRMPKQISQEERQRDLTARLTAAQAQKEEKYGGLNALSGIAREVASLDALEKQVGKDSPIYLRAKDAFDRDQERVQENIRSSQFYRENPWRLYDPVTKQFHAQKHAAQGEFPEGGEAYENPEQISEAVNTYEKERYSKTTPTFLQQQYEAAQQIDELLKNIDPKKAFSYSGIKGTADLWKDRYEAQSTGKISDRLKDFEEQQSFLHGLREKVRNYWGSSITAGMTENLDYLVNPSNWKNHPEIAERKFNAVVKDYENEKKVTERAIKHGNPSAPKPIFSQAENAKLKEIQNKTPKEMDDERALELSKKMLSSSNNPGGSDAKITMIFVDPQTGQKIKKLVPLNEISEARKNGGVEENG